MSMNVATNSTSSPLAGATNPPTRKQCCERIPFLSQSVYKVNDRGF
jgi:hypothetical protein